jgi:hypothetical protein
MAQTQVPPDVPTYASEPLQDGKVQLESTGPGLEPRSSTPIILKPRPISPTDARKLKPTLGPPPAFLEPNKSARENAPSKGPETPKRSGLGLRGVGLQLSMPSKESNEGLATSTSAQRVPQSPKLDTSPGFASPGSVLPRRSRGLDYTRACTNLHHSTIAEQSSPDSSPVIGGRGMNIPRRVHGGMSGPDSPMFAASNWTTMGNSDAKTTISSSVGSANLLGSGSDSDSSDDDMAGDEEDTIHVTPQPFKSHNAFGIVANASPGMETMSSFSQAAASLMSFQRRTRKSRSTRHSSSSASGRSSMPSPAPGSPPLLKSIEQSAAMGYFDKEMRPKSVESRRESLSLGTGDLHISDGADEDSGSLSDAFGLSIHGASSADGRRSVIKRAVTRRSNMLVS